MATGLHKVTYVSEYGELPYQELYLPEDYVVVDVLIPQLTDDGYRFLGWYLTSTFDEGTKIEVGDTLDPTPHTFYAKWEPITVKSTMTALADEIRILSGTEDGMSLDDMTTHVGEANDNVATEADLIAQINSALEGKAAGGASIETCTVKIKSTSHLYHVVTTIVTDEGLAVYSHIDIGSDGEIYELTIENVLCGSALGVNSNVEPAHLIFSGGVEFCGKAREHFSFKTPITGNATAFINIYPAT